jgi:hypothetical protein
VYHKPHFGPRAFFRQIIALKITLKNTHAFSTIFVGTKVSLEAFKPPTLKSEKMCKKNTFMNRQIIWEDSQ